MLEDLSTLHPEQIEAPYLLAVLLCYYEEEYGASVDWLITSLTRRYVATHTIGDADILFMVGAIDYPYVYRALSDEIARYDAAAVYGLRDLFYLLRAELLNQRGYTDDALADLDSVSSFSFGVKWSRCWSRSASTSWCTWSVGKRSSTAPPRSSPSSPTRRPTIRHARPPTIPWSSTRPQKPTCVVPS